MKQVARVVSADQTKHVRRIANLDKDDQLFVNLDGFVVIAPKHNATDPVHQKSRIVTTEKGKVKIEKGQVVIVEEKK